MYDSTAGAFSPGGEVLYLVTTTNVVLAVDSDGSTSTHSVKYSGGDDLCDIAVSPDGLSVRHFHFFKRTDAHILRRYVFRKPHMEIGVHAKKHECF